jgi:23S rRNA (cytidine1920-2'-O)/16S rRNA (cytidine1409-2'-O)-methyltransferase
MASRRRRLDEALVEAGLFETRDAAARAVMAGKVLLNGQPESKSGTPVRPDDTLSLAPVEKFVGRGGFKLEAALDAFAVDPAGKVCLDVGASTGGFTDCLLQRGAAKVYAIDAGKNQLDWRLRADPRVESREGVNARYLEPADFEPAPALGVGDVSFISLTAILPAVFRVVEPGGGLVFLIKPQFEAPRESVGAGGIVRDDQVRQACIEKIRVFVLEAGHEWLGVVTSPITGRDGNVEYLCHVRSGAAAGF